MFAAFIDISDWIILVADHYVIALLMALLALLLGAVVLRMAVRRSQIREGMSAARAAELESDEAPESAPSASGAAQRRAPQQLTPADTPTAPVRQPTPIPAASPVAAEEMEKSDPGEAARLWERLGKWEDAARCHEACGSLERAGEICMALAEKDRALPLLREALSRSPEKENLRLKLVGLLLDRGEMDDAEDLIRPVAEADAPLPASAGFMESVARNFEALSQMDKAIEYYQLALLRDSGLVESEQRLLFLKQMKRLNSEANGALAGSSATQLLDKYIRESAVTPIPAPRHIMEAEASTAGHEIVVGHLALGCQRTEPQHSVRSVFSLSRRFTLERLLAETPRTAVFEARDRLLDYKVALKLVRLNPDEFPLDVLKERLGALAQLNHPNLAKVTFVDREDSVLRVATEYLPGGNLRDFVTKLSGVGTPLLLRICIHLASALHTAHVRGVPHGDLRPENILVAPDQRIKLVDFAFSPIPVRRINFARVSPDGTDPGKPAELYSNPGVQSDLLQFGELLDFLLTHSRRPTDLVAGKTVIDPTEELRELVDRLREGSFLSMLRLWQVLEQIFERTHPNSSSDNSRLRP